MRALSYSRAHYEQNKEREPEEPQQITVVRKRGEKEQS